MKRVGAGGGVGVAAELTTVGARLVHGWTAHEGGRVVAALISVAVTEHHGSASWAWVTRTSAVDSRMTLPRPAVAPFGLLGGAVVEADRTG